MAWTWLVWQGKGAVGRVLLGILLFDEPKNIVSLFCSTLIIGGIAGVEVVRSFLIESVFLHLLSYMALRF